MLHARDHLEEYFYGYDRNRPHQMRSFTKSVISLLAGVAVDRGLLRADEPVLARLGYSAYKNRCSGGLFTTGRIIERVAGKPLPEFAQEVLFEPLGIRRGDWKWYFALDRSERNEFGQIYLRPRAMLKLGLLIERRGEWEGRRVVSASWIDAATARQSRIEDRSTLAIARDVTRKMAHTSGRADACVLFAASSTMRPSGLSIVVSDPPRPRCVENRCAARA